MGFALFLVEGKKTIKLKMKFSNTKKQPYHNHAAVSSWLLVRRLNVSEYT